jgi:hypothetical protein
LILKAKWIEKSQQQKIMDIINIDWNNFARNLNDSNNFENKKIILVSGNSNT